MMAEKNVHCCLKDEVLAYVYITHNGIEEGPCGNGGNFGLYYPDRAMSLAFVLLNELLEVLKIRTCLVVFFAFSGSPKACMYKVLQLLGNKRE
ncbi:hypothetical protein F3Y22_tig00007204pilonHSYRG00066 [Hibiscus syriacus]|uniref:Uncharacterized protein n=1 Tax=Hibiscus syriacus TaxID=106335 RepID=A0A6A3CAH6_HIBSY|nr:hypothetical protein F3Y22_tig00007204pilonHSYRG00066 [Hibiscus syriacus]